MFTVYRASGSKSGLAYYGYCQGDDVSGAFGQFGRSETSRADVRLMMANGTEDVDDLKIEVIDACTDELEALVARNDLRSTMTDSISGPTLFPLAARAGEIDASSIDLWNQATTRFNAKTAREALARGQWTFQQIKDLSNAFDRKNVIKDLDALSPFDFAVKYQLS